MDIIKKIAEETEVRQEQVKAAIELLDEGCTVPFIARYRKERTGSLNDEQLRKLSERLTYLRNLEEKKTSVLSAIDEQGKLTPALRREIEACETLVKLEDLYRPYRPKRRTRAAIAKEAGLEPLAGVVETAVNKVGVDLNTASAALLEYVSGVTKPIAKNIVSYREENGRFTERKQLLNVPRLGAKAFEQCAGFLRISDGKNPLDATAVHPESYEATEQLLLSVNGDTAALKSLSKQEKSRLSHEIGVGSLLFPI